MLVDVQRLQADPSTLSLDTDNDGNFDKNLTPDSVLDMDNLINFDPTHKPKDGIVITDNSSPSSSGGGGGGFPTLPTVVVQSDKLFDSNKIIIQEKEEIISNIPLVKKQVKEITKVKIAQETKDIFSKEKIINQPIYTNETELKDKNNNLNLEAAAFSGNINIKLIILIIIFLSVVIILLLVNKFSKFKNL